MQPYLTSSKKTVKGKEEQKLNILFYAFSPNISIFLGGGSKFQAGKLTKTSFNTKENLVEEGFLGRASSKGAARVQTLLINESQRK